MAIVHTRVGSYNFKEIARHPDSENQLAALFGDGLTYSQFYDVLNHLQHNKDKLMAGMHVDDWRWVHSMTAPHDGLTRILHIAIEGPLAVVRTTDFTGNPWSAYKLDESLDLFDKLSAEKKGIATLKALRAFYIDNPDEALGMPDVLKELEEYAAAHGI